MKKRILTGVLLGATAGILDVIPMVLQGLTWDANISAFSLWVIAGFMIATSSLKINKFLKGIIIPLLIFIPCGFIIAWNNPGVLLPIIPATIVLGALLGFAIDKFIND